MSDFDAALKDIQVDIALHEMSKHAGFWGAFSKGTQQAVIGTAVSTGIMAAGGMAISGIGAIKENIDKNRGFKAMLELNPGIKKMDRKRVKATFNSLHAMNSDYAKDPLISGSFIAKTMESGTGKELGLGGGFIDMNTTKALSRPKGRNAMEDALANAARPNWAGINFKDDD